MPRRSLTIGVLGGIGSGKSFVATIFRQMGASVIDADRIVRRLLKSRAVKRDYIRAWGREVLKPNGSLDPAAVARAVFGRPAQVRRLNRLIHPRVLREMKRQIRACRGRLAVIDAPLLLETGTDRLCDVLIFVDAPRSRRLARVRRTRGWSAEDLARRESAQWPLSKKRERADYILRNEGSAACIRKRTAELMRKILAG